MSKIDDLQSVVRLWRNYTDNNPNAEAWELEWQLKRNIVPLLNDLLQAGLPGVHKNHELEASVKDIVHYTSLDRLISMILDYEKSGTSFLRMYDSFHLNDPQEGQYLARFVEVPDNWFQEEKASHAYVASFVMPDQTKGQEELGDHDNLKYWLAYGRQGKGCSIRFRVNHKPFQKVLYGGQKAARTIEELGLQCIVDSLHPLTGHPDPKWKSLSQKVVAETVWANLASIRYLYKGEAYDYEQECRLVKAGRDVPGADAHFERIDSGDRLETVRHYYLDGDLKIDQILASGTTITLGPTVSRPHNMVYYLETLLDRVRFSGPRVEISKIPYREPWR